MQSTQKPLAGLLFVMLFVEDESHALFGRIEESDFKLIGFSEL
jgi:hypothetical protein